MNLISWAQGFATSQSFQPDDNDDLLLKIVAPTTKVVLQNGRNVFKFEIGKLSLSKQSAARFTVDDLENRASAVEAKNWAKRREWKLLEARQQLPVCVCLQCHTHKRHTIKLSFQWFKLFHFKLLEMKSAPKSSKVKLRVRVKRLNLGTGCSGQHRKWSATSAHVIRDHNCTIPLELDCPPGHAHTLWFKTILSSAWRYVKVSAVKIESHQNRNITTREIVLPIRELLNCDESWLKLKIKLECSLLNRTLITALNIEQLFQFALLLLFNSRIEPISKEFTISLLLSYPLERTSTARARKSFLIIQMFILPFLLKYVCRLPVLCLSLWLPYNLAKEKRKREMEKV